MTLPNFLIIGTAKSGTSSLYMYLKEHPQIFMSSPKEPTFFGHEGESGLFNGPGDNDEVYRSRMLTNIDAYTALFKGVTDQKAVGEASIFYLYLSKAPSRIKKYIPNAAMFAVLRNPADRAYSNYLHLVRQQREPYTFARALQEEPARIKNNWNEFWHYKSLGFYSEQVKRYYDMFGRSQVHIYLYEDLQKSPLSLVKEIFEILGIDSSFAPNISRRYNVGYVPRSPALSKGFYKTKALAQSVKKLIPQRLHWRMNSAVAIAERAERRNRVPRPPIQEEVRVSLLRDYRDDILRLGDLLRRDLSHWCSVILAVVGQAVIFFWMNNCEELI